MDIKPSIEVAQLLELKGEQLMTYDEKEKELCIGYELHMWYSEMKKSEIKNVGQGGRGKGSERDCLKK